MVLLVRDGVGLQALGLSLEHLSGEAPFGIDSGCTERHMDGNWIPYSRTETEYADTRPRWPSLATGRVVDPVRDYHR